MNLLHHFDHALAGRRGAIGLEWDKKQFTFGAIEERSNRVANALRARGFQKGDRLCVYLPNSAELIDIFLACVKLGVIFVPINILYRDREIEHITRDAQPREVITSPEGLASDNAARPHESLESDTPAAIIYTSGTTGAAKGAILTHDNFISNSSNLLAAWEITGADRLLLALPLFHVHALGNGLHCWLASGCRMRLLERFDHRTAAEEFLDFRPTLFFGVPTMYIRLLDPLPGVSVRIVDGELQVRSPTVFAGYWRNPDATAAAFDDGWFKTGDLASVSDDGYITLLGRKSDLIISGGFNIYPHEIEELLLEQAGVREAAVIGVADKIRGEVPVAYIVGEASEDDLERACRQQLASFKVPRRFIHVDAIPRTALGKVQKHLLADGLE